MKESIEVKPILEQILARPPLDPGVADETAASFRKSPAGWSVALARSFRILDSDLENPGPEEWGRAFKLFNLLL